MKILITRPAPNLGGVSNYFDILAKYLKDFELEQLIVGKRFHRNVNKFRIIKDYIKFYQKIKNNRFQLIHLNPSLDIKSLIRESIFLAIAYYCNVKTIVFFHGWYHTTEKLIKNFLLPIFKKTFLKTNGIIVLSHAFKATIIDFGYKKEVFVLPTLVDDSYVDLIRKRNWNKKNIELLFLSRIIKEKGIFETLDSFSILSKKYDNINLTIVGDGKELNQAKKYVEKHSIPKISFKGYLDGKAKAEAFNKADIFIFPSYSEGMPTTVLEAMLFGLSIVTTPVGGLKDFFKDGKMGYIIENHNPVLIAKKTEKLITNISLRAKIAHFNHNFVVEHFLASKVAKDIKSIYSKIINDM